jgi:hypothetical protein
MTATCAPTTVRRPPPHCRSRQGQRSAIAAQHSILVSQGAHNGVIRTKLESVACHARVTYYRFVEESGQGGGPEVSAVCAGWVCGLWQGGSGGSYACLALAAKYFLGALSIASSCLSLSSEPTTSSVQPSFSPQRQQQLAVPPSCTCNRFRGDCQYHEH